MVNTCWSLNDYHHMVVNKWWSTHMAKMAGNTRWSNNMVKQCLSETVIAHFGRKSDGQQMMGNTLWSNIWSTNAGHQAMIHKWWPATDGQQMHAKSGYLKVKVKTRQTTAGDNTMHVNSCWPNDGQQNMINNDDQQMLVYKRWSTNYFQQHMINKWWSTYDD